MGTFDEDLRLEERFYQEVFKPWLNSRGNDSIFIRFNSNSVVYESLQKKHDIDVVLDNGTENITLSLKTVRKVYDRIFFETIGNCTKDTPGWGYYSQADWIVYSMGAFDAGFVSIAFRPDAVRGLNLDGYSRGYGETRDHRGKLLYKTEGRLVPIADFKHVALFDTLHEPAEAFLRSA